MQQRTEHGKQDGQRVTAGERAWCFLLLLLLAVALPLRAQETPSEADPAAQNSAPVGAEAGAEKQADPPSRVVRVSVLQGNVSAEAANVSTFVPAELNQVLTTGDRVYTDPTAVAELEAGQVAVRMAGGTDLTVSAMTDQVAQFGLAAGSAHLRSFGLQAGTVLEMDTPEAAITVLQPGDLRVEEDASGRVTTVAVVSGQVQVDGPALSRVLNAGERVRVHGSDPQAGQAAYLEPLSSAEADGLDQFSEARDGLYSNGAQGSSEYVNPETTGSAELAASGTWDTDDEVGPVWYPTVAVTWRPYTFGHWRYVAPWGWTWVGDEPWAFAPFHYGRWLCRQGRWGWVPGVPGLRPVYAPALVAFAGGRQFAASAGLPPGGGLTAWFPLGPREPYQPPYRGSTRYVNRVNASNIANRNLAEARAQYGQRAVDAFDTDQANVRTYVNRGAGTVAVAHSSFAGGQAVARSQLAIPARELAAAPLLTRPAEAPAETVYANGVVRGPVAVNAHRPSVLSGERARTEVVPPHLDRPAFAHAPAPAGAEQGFAAGRGVQGRTDVARPGLQQQGGGVFRAPRVESNGGVREGVGVSRPAGAPAAPRPAPAPVPAAAAAPAGHAEPARAGAAASPRR